MATTNLFNSAAAIGKDGNCERPPTRPELPPKAAIIGSRSSAAACRRVERSGWRSASRPIRTRCDGGSA